MRRRLLIGGGFVGAFLLGLIIGVAGSGIPEEDTELADARSRLTDQEQTIERLREENGNLRSDNRQLMNELRKASMQADLEAPAEEPEPGPKMERVRFELLRYDDKTPIPCGSITEAGRVLAVGYAEMNKPMHWNMRVDYVNHQRTAGNGAEWYQLTPHVYSEAGLVQVVRLVQQIDTLGEHTFRLAHSGDKDHVHDCTITKGRE